MRTFVIVSGLALVLAHLLGPVEPLCAAPLTVAALKITQEEPEVAKRALARYLSTNDTGIIEEAYQSFKPPFPRVPYMTEEFIRSVLSVSDHPKAAKADPKDFFDNRFLKELEETGFVQELYSWR